MATKYCCVKCCMEKISYSKNLDDKIKTTWVLFDNYFCGINNSQESDNNMKLSIIFAFISVPSLFLSTVRVLFLKFFELKNINIEILEKGKWLPQNTNINSRLIESLFTTQKIQIPQSGMILDAISFFTSDRQNLHRNKAAHDIIASINSTSYITINDVYDKFIEIAYAIACFDKIIEEQKRFYSK